jgi:hypothetical protein
MYFVKIAKFRFICPISGLATRKGEVYLEDEEGGMLHIGQMPERRLRKLESREHPPCPPSKGEKSHKIGITTKL